MPKLGTIYALVSPDGRVRYVGQTRQPLRRRIAAHEREGPATLWREAWRAWSVTPSPAAERPRYVELDRVPGAIVHAEEGEYIKAIGLMDEPLANTVHNRDYRPRESTLGPAEFGPLPELVRDNPDSARLCRAVELAHLTNLGLPAAERETRAAAHDRRIAVLEERAADGRT